MGILITIIVGLIGIIVTWRITKISTYQSTEEFRKEFEQTKIELRETKKVLEVLPDEVKKIIRESNVEKLTIKELNQLINEKVIDDKSSDLLPYKRCPKCGSKNIEKTHIAFADWDIEGGAHLGGYLDQLSCNDCDWITEKNY